MMDKRILMILFAVMVSGCGEEPAPEESRAAGPAGVVILDSLQLGLAGIKYAVVEPLPPDTLHLTGSVTYDAARVSHVGPRMQGRIRRVPVEIGSPIEVDDTLVVLDSPELGAAQAAWFTVSVEREVSKRNYDRAERLYRDGIVSERRRLEAEGTFRQAEGQLVAAERALAALGAQPDSAASSVFVLRSPLAGIVVDKHATTGEVVASDAQLFTVADLSQLWIILDVYETDLSRVTANSPVVLTTQAYPNRLFHGHVAYVGAIVDTTSRTVKVRVEIPNADLTLKPGMFARADLVLTDAAPTIGVPQDAIQTLEGRTVVFVKDGANRFRIADVVIGRTRAGGWIEILDGLARGDTVVAEGSFSLKADLLKASFGEEGH